MIVRVPRERLALAGIPDKPFEVFSAWPMGKHLGLWLGEPGQRTGPRWPVTNVTRAELKKWEVESGT